MKRNNDLSISPTTSSSVPSPDDLSTPTFLSFNAVTPGCPTDSNLYAQQLQTSLRTPLSTFKNMPRTATTMARRHSVVPGSSTGPTTEFDSHAEGAPGRVQQWRIQPGTFIAFELDTNLVADQMQTDCAAVDQVRTFSKNRYIGLVLWSHTYTIEPESDDDGSLSDDSPAEVVEELIVNFVSPHPPPAPLQAHYIPIAPMSSKSPINEAPLQTSTLFPYPNLYQYTTLGTRLEVRTMHDSSLRFGLKEDEFGRLDERIALDFGVLGKLGPEDEKAQRLKVPMYSLPARVWRDVREASHSHGLKKSGSECITHPSKFVDEVEGLARLVPALAFAMADSDVTEQSSREQPSHKL
ncbi:hypothetical protein EIP91_010979 [Steccherinum ochraceum]|uniref:Uncharacterized protein n=1 Tax=Steccherinum ochraceum TaxID=92696 RepID=A0A4R0RIX8_9APHY|nr:hypothetical protein EIP91_010979 [Steccherinum ochraceum]